jgi:hypothetical protein
MLRAIGLKKGEIKVIEITSIMMAGYFALCLGFSILVVMLALAATPIERRKGSVWNQSPVIPDRRN